MAGTHGGGLFIENGATIKVLVLPDGHFKLALAVHQLNIHHPTWTSALFASVLNVCICMCTSINFEILIC